MKLIDLQPRFLQLSDETSTWHCVDDIAKADGIVFLCPLCFRNKGLTPVGVHSIICWQPHVPVELGPKPGRWQFVGTGYGDLTLKAGSSSVLLLGGCKAHFFVTGGTINFC